MEEISGRHKALPETQTQDIRHWLTCLNGLTWTEDQGFLREFIFLRAISITTILIFVPVVAGFKFFGSCVRSALKYETRLKVFWGS